MRGRCLVRRISPVIIASLTMAALGAAGPVRATTALGLTGLRSGTASAAACRGWKLVQAPSPDGEANLSGVAAIPRSSDAWATGQYVNGNGRGVGFLLRWNGTRWQQVRSPYTGRGGSRLGAVATASAADAWAVGYYIDGYRFGRTLTLHWNGRAWKQVPSPAPGGRGAASGLSGVAAISRSDAWAVGNANNATLILRWNGKAWRQVPSPNPAPGGDSLAAVAAVSGADAWAVGEDGEEGVQSTTLIEHWNGKAWQQVPSPNPQSGYWANSLFGVAATSATSAWAVGYASYNPPGGEHPVGSSDTSDVPIVEHWNGTRWKLVPSPSQSPDDLFAVTAVSARNAWAVGGVDTVTSSNVTLVEHWNGRAWNQVPSLSVAGGGYLYSVAASSTGKLIWAVGEYNGSPNRSLALYRC